MTDLERARDELRKARTLLARWQGSYEGNAIADRVFSENRGEEPQQPTESERLLYEQTKVLLDAWQAGFVSGK